MANRALNVAREYGAAAWEGFSGSFRTAYFVGCLGVLAVGCVWFALQTCASLTVEAAQSLLARLGSEFKQRD